MGASDEAVAVRGARELLSNPHRVNGLSAAEAAEALAELARLQAALAARLHALPSSTEPMPLACDRLLTAEDVAERFGRSVAWVYRQAKHWNFTRRVTRRTVRFSEAGLQLFLARRRTFAP